MKPPYNVTSKRTGGHDDDAAGRSRLLTRVAEGGRTLNERNVSMGSAYTLNQGPYSTDKIGGKRGRRHAGKLGD